MRHQKFMASDRHCDGAQLPEVRAVRMRLYGTFAWTRPLSLNDQGVENTEVSEEMGYLAVNQPAALLSFADLHFAERHRPPLERATVGINASETAG